MGRTVTKLRGLALAALVGFAVARPVSALAQDTNTVGPPTLRDFQLAPTNQTSPVPEPEQEVPAQTPPPAPPPIAEPVPEAPTSLPVATPAPDATVSEDAPEEAAPPPQPATSAPAAPNPVTEAAPEAGNMIEAALPPAEVEPAPAAPPAPAPRKVDWTPWAGGGAVALSLLALLVWRRRRRTRDMDEAEIVEAEPEAAEPAVVGPRPWIELEFTPEKAVATDSDASVHFALSLVNQGDADARDVRIRVRMFNAAVDRREIDAFIAEPFTSDGAASPFAVNAQGELQLRSSVAMAKSDVRAVTIQGRALFIPMVAVNVVYAWGEGQSGRTSATYLVGTEAPVPAEKMGAFRLDLGPRIYRSVGGRRLEAAAV